MFVSVSTTCSLYVGDIGTSPLYVYSTIFDKQPTEEDVLCATSLIFWSITLVVMVKYVFIVLLADDNGEGEHAEQQLARRCLTI